MGQRRALTVKRATRDLALRLAAEAGGPASAQELLELGEAGLRKIEEIEQYERQQKARFEKALEEAKQMLFSWLPDAMQPYAKLLDLDVVEEPGGIKPDYGWFAVKVPDLALISVYVKKATPPEITYWVHDPAVVEIGLDDDFDRTVVYHLKDHRIALARAYELMRKHMWETNGSVPGIPSVTKEPRYEPFEQDLIDSNGQFDSPLAAFYSNYIYRML